MIKLPCYFVVLNERFKVLLKGDIDENRSVMLTFRYNALGDKHVSESYSSFDEVLVAIPAGTLPTIQFGDENTIEQFL